MALLLDFQWFPEWHFELIVERRSQWAAANTARKQARIMMMRLEMDDYSKRNATATYHQICKVLTRSRVGLRRHP